MAPASGGAIRRPRRISAPAASTLERDLELDATAVALAPATVRVRAPRRGRARTGCGAGRAAALGARAKSSTAPPRLTPQKKKGEVVGLVAWPASLVGDELLVDGSVSDWSK
jgi:hypothetical protein